MRAVSPRLLSAALVLTLLALSACSQRTSSTNTPLAVTATPAAVTDTPVAVTTGKQIVTDSISTTTPLGDSADPPAIRSYHTVLLFERAADLILALIEKIHAGEISPSDPSTTAPYTNAYIIASDSFNETRPPPELRDVWEQLFRVAQQYRQAYTLIVLQMPVSSENLDKLKESRELLVFDQEMVERYLVQSGLKPDIFVDHQEMADQLLQQRYGDQPVPVLLP